MTVRAKFRVETLTQTQAGYSVELKPVTGGSPENEQFFKWTPWGDIKMGTINAEAAQQFKPGTEFYVDFTPAN